MFSRRFQGEKNGNIGLKWINTLSANPTKLSNTLKQFVGKSVGLADELYECLGQFCGIGT